MAAERETCATPECTRVPWRRGLCGTCYRRTTHPRVLAPLTRHEPPERVHHHTHHDPGEEEPAELEWAPSTPQAQRILAALDRLLGKIENANYLTDPGDPAPPALVAAYWAMGGRAYSHRGPTGGELHAAVLDLEDGYVRSWVPRV